MHAVAAHWFHTRWPLDVAQLSMLFFAVQLVAGLSSLGVVPLAKRFGLLNTMVWTHVPASVLLILVPWMPSAELAMALFVLRMSVNQMDVPTRQSYLAAIVAPEERMPAAGVTNVARTAAAAISPPLAMAAIGAGAFAAPFVIAGTLKITYDFLVWRAFRGVVPPEERGDRRVEKSGAATP